MGDRFAQFHSEIDRAKHCALSIVTRYAFILSDHICMDLGIDMVLGRHVPADSDVAAASQHKTEQDALRTRSTVDNSAADYETEDGRESEADWKWVGGRHSSRSMAFGEGSNGGGRAYDKRLVGGGGGGGGGDSDDSEYNHKYSDQRPKDGNAQLPSNANVRCANRFFCFVIQTKQTPDVWSASSSARQRTNGPAAICRSSGRLWMNR